jgi:hypothetical protein
MRKRSGVLCTLSLLLLAAGCQSTAINTESKSTFLNSDDMERMTNQMATSIIGDPRITAAAANGPLTIVIKPVDNLTNEIIPDNRAELFVARLQGLLASRPELSNRFIWVINRSDYEKLRHEEVPAEKLGPSEERIQPAYALWAEFHSATDAKKNSRSDMYLCQYKLTRISGGNEGTILWTGQYETSKAIKRSFLD